MGLARSVVLDIRGLDVVEQDDQMRTPRGDVEQVPAVTGQIFVWLDLCHVDDRASAVLQTALALVVDIDLVTCLRARLVGILIPYVDAGIGFRSYPNLGPDLEILVGFLRNQKAAALVGDDGA